jgi:hypothetical protein
MASWKSFQERSSTDKRIKTKQAAIHIAAGLPVKQGFSFLEEKPACVSVGQTHQNAI